MAKWNLNEIIEPEGINTLKKSLIGKVENFKNYRSKLNDETSIEILNEILILKEEMFILMSRISNYIYLKVVEDTSNIENNALQNEINQFTTELFNEILFFTIWFKNLDVKKANFFINNLNKYSYYLKSIRKTKDFVLNEDLEKVINLKDLSGNEQLVKLYDIITNRYIYDFKDEKISLEQLRTYTRSFNRDDRKLAYDLILNKYSDEEAILGEIYHSIVLDWYNENINLRKYESPISVRNISNDVSDKSVNAMLSSVRKNVNIFHEYFKLKGKIMGYELDRFDIYADIKNEIKNYDYDKSKKIVIDTYNQFSPEMCNLVNLVFNKEHVHSEMIKNKRSGAFCLTVNNNFAPYVMLNHNNSLECLFTMMHEMGHAIHSLLSNKHSNLVSHPSLPLAETASIFGEMLLSQEFLKNSDNEIKKTVLVKLLDSEFASIIRQTYFTFFEIEAHNAIAKGASINDLNEIYFKLSKEKFGSLHLDDKFKHEWKYVSHFFHSPFYCYAYAFANLLVLALYDFYLTEGDEFKQKYIKLLSKGGSDSPLNILNEIGINIEDESFWDKGFNVIKNQIEELKKLL
jgi:oligoendopeptidase F